MSALVKAEAKPIIFSGEMIRAILDGRKTQTRRIIPARLFICLDPELPEDSASILQACPYGQAGGLLWVREAFRVTEAFESVYYRADDPDPEGDSWRPSIHMPRWAARLYLRLEAVRIERLQDISESDCYQEGVRLPTSGVFPPAYRQDFYDLWQRINGQRAPWADNPYVWVLTFKRLLP